MLSFFSIEVGTVSLEAAEDLMRLFFDLVLYSQYVCIPPFFPSTPFSQLPSPAPPTLQQHQLSRQPKLKVYEYNES